jgi:hypothetical protein
MGLCRRLPNAVTTGESTYERTVPYGVFLYIEVPGIRSQNRLKQPSASGYHFDNGVMEVILPLIPGAAASKQRYSFSIIHVINDHIESRSTNGCPGYTYVPTQL